MHGPLNVKFANSFQVSEMCPSARIY